MTASVGDCVSDHCPADADGQVQRVASRFGLIAAAGEGAVGTFGFGRSRGVIEGTLGALGVPVVTLVPAWWKRRVDIAPGADRRDEARSKVIARWPGMADRFARKRDDGRAEAALIAAAGMAREAGRSVP